ncbi:hypothetical protein MMC15_007300 [Xylographa vitiligo]|nr:hypothetical protein [Xylographa vitiligo]
MSLTICAEPALPVQYTSKGDYMSLSGSDESSGVDNVWRRFCDLPDKIQSMTILTTFSFIVSENELHQGEYISRQVLARIIRSLPDTCSSLEIDTKGRDFDQNPRPGEIHLCDAIRAMLPRLRHLRLQISKLCPFFCAEQAVFSIGVYDLSHFRPIVAPNLDTLMVICISEYVEYSIHLGLCNYGSYQDGRWILGECLRALGKQGNHPNKKRFYLLDSPLATPYNSLRYAALNKWDIVENTTWTILFRQVSLGEDIYLVRTPDGGEYVSPIAAIGQIAEGELWQETTTGIRLPYAVWAAQKARTYGRTLKRPPYERSRDWKARNPEVSYTPWRDEIVAGMKFLDAERRDSPY